MPTAAPDKKALTVAQAADQWEHAKREIARLKGELEEAEPVLRAYFRRTGRRSYKNRIALVTNPGRLILDQPKLRAYLGKRLPQFQKRTEPSESLALLD